MSYYSSFLRLLLAVSYSAEVDSVKNKFHSYVLEKHSQELASERTHDAQAPLNKLLPLRCTSQKP